MIIWIYFIAVFGTLQYYAYEMKFFFFLSYEETFLTFYIKQTQIAFNFDSGFT